MEVGGPHLRIVRTWIDEGAERATEDFDRFYAVDLPELSEPGLRDRFLRIDEPDLELAAALEALHDQPEGTLGWAYIEFYRRNDITVPGADTHTPADYVSHDMNHVISGYEPTGPGEIALGAFTLAMNDNDANWLQFVANLVIHEAGLLKHGEIAPKASTLTRDGATDLLGEAFAARRALHQRFQPGRSPHHGRVAAGRGACALQRRTARAPDVLTPGPAWAYARPMLDHLSIQCADVAATTTFYDAVLAPLGGGRVMDFGEVIGYGIPGKPSFWIGPLAADVENREVHVAFVAPDRAAVQAFFAAAVGTGAEVLHEPRVWTEYHPSYFAAFVRDPDGNNIEAVCHAPE